MIRSILKQCNKSHALHSSIRHNHRAVQLGNLSVSVVNSSHYNTRGHEAQAATAKDDKDQRQHNHADNIGSIQPLSKHIAADTIVAVFYKFTKKQYVTELELLLFALKKMDVSLSHTIVKLEFIIKICTGVCSLQAADCEPNFVGAALTQNQFSPESTIA